LASQYLGMFIRGPGGRMDVDTLVDVLLYLYKLFVFFKVF